MLDGGASANYPALGFSDNVDVGLYYESGALGFTYDGNVQLKITSTHLQAHNDIEPNASGSYHLGKVIRTGIRCMLIMEPFFRL